MRFSIVIPARNEERNLPECLRAIKESAGLGNYDYEIIVVANRCEDRTVEVAQAQGCRVVTSEAKNLAAIRNSGAKMAQGELLVTIDADSRMSPRMLSHIDQAMRRGDSIGGGVMILPERWSLGIFLSGALLIPIALWYRIAGGLFFCERKTFEEIGGFNESLASVEDIDFARRLKRHGREQGKRFKIIVRSYIVTSCRKFDTFGDWFPLLHPIQMIKLLRGRNQQLADKYWYDYRP